MEEKQFWVLLRQALLMVLDAIEKRYNLERTAEIRKAYKKIVRQA